MKKICILTLASLLLVLLLTSCSRTAPSDSSNGEEGASPIRIGAMTGPTGMGMVQLMQTGVSTLDTAPYDFTLAATADMLTPSLIQGDLDMASIPANLAAVLYNQTQGELQVLAVNTLGVLYIVTTGDEEITSIEDLASKTIYATGQGSTPEYTLRYLLSSHGLDPDKDVTIEFKSEPAEVVSALGQSGGIAMLPQPYVVAAQSQLENLQVALDLTQEWDSLSTDSSLITGVLVVRKDFAEAHPEAVANFLTAYKASISYVNEHVPEAAQLMEQFEIAKAPVAEKAIPYCNITFLAGEEMQKALSGYLEVLYAQNPKAVGGTLPDEAFYYLS